MLPFSSLSPCKKQQIRADFNNQQKTKLSPSLFHGEKAPTTSQGYPHTSSSLQGAPSPFPSHLKGVIFKFEGLSINSRGFVSRERDFPAEQLCKCRCIPASDGAAIARGLRAGWRWLCRAAPVGRAALVLRTDPEGLQPVPSAFPAVLACEKRRENESACKEPVNTLRADLREGGDCSWSCVYLCKAGMRQMGETAGKGRFLGGLAGYRVVLSSTLAVCLSKICLCCETSGWPRCQGGREGPRVR